MTRWAIVLLLALAWTGLTGVLTVPNLAVGLALGLLAARATGRPAEAAPKGPPASLEAGDRTPPSGNRRRRRGAGRALFVALRLPGFLLFLAWELVLSNLRVARDVIAPRLRLRPGILAVPLDVETEAEIALLAVLVTLTPGTLSLDISDDRRTLYIHAASLEDPERTRASIKQGFERRVLELCR